MEELTRLLEKNEALWDSLAPYVKGIRPRTLRTLIGVVHLLRVQFEYGKDFEYWFENEMTMEDVKQAIIKLNWKSSDRTAWDYFKTLKALGVVFL